MRILIAFTIVFFSSVVNADIKQTHQDWHYIKFDSDNVMFAYVDGSQNASFNVRCVAGGDIAMFINLPPYMVIDGSKETIKFRVDRNGAMHIKFKRSRSGASVFLESNDLISEMIKGRSLFVKTHVASGRESRLLHMWFSLMGMQNALVPLKEKCGFER